MPDSLKRDPEEAAPAELFGAGDHAWLATPRLRVGRGLPAEGGARALAAETPVAIVYDAATYAVMMATPADLEDFAVGFSLTEGVITDPAEVDGMELAPGPAGVEVRLWLRPGRRQALAERRRRLAGPTGCGLCGIDSLAEALRPAPRVGAGVPLTAAQVFDARAALEPAQALGRRTRAVHAAGFWRPDTGLAALREDVGRHNALDKLCGALRRQGVDGSQGAVVLTSRVSVEMVQKAAVVGAGVLIAISAPTTLAVEVAQAARITLVAVAREDGFEVFSHAHRIRA